MYIHGPNSSYTPLHGAADLQPNILSRQEYAHNEGSPGFKQTPARKSLLIDGQALLIGNIDILMIYLLTSLKKKFRVSFLSYGCKSRVNRALLTLWLIV